VRGAEVFGKRGEAFLRAQKNTDETTRCGTSRPEKRAISTRKGANDAETDWADVSVWIEDTATQRAVAV